MGVLCGRIDFFALGIIAAEWWQWVITAAISVSYMHIGLSKTAGENTDAVRRHYDETAVKLYGKYAAVKINLTIILLAVFFGTAIFIRFVFGIITPVGVTAVFCIILIISAI